jgi:hypothetical protein
MTKEQIEILRSLIRGEIEAALMNENGYRFAFEQEQSNDQGWETFIDSFTRLRMTTTGGDSVGNV